MSDISIAMRAVLLVLTTVVGLFVPILLLAAAGIAISLYGELCDPKPPNAAPPRPPTRATVTAADPEWQKLYLAACESPAETAFLEAAIRAFSLLPEGARLRGDGISMALQVPLDRYRLDFLIDGWLVVEIDGAAWHSSPDAVERDEARDSRLAQLGYRTTRIPARTVFRAPEAAIRQVRRALAEGRPANATRWPSVRDAVTPTPPAKAMPSQRMTFGHILEGMAAQSAIRKALAPVRHTLEYEENLIDKAIDASKRAKRIDDWLEANPDLRPQYEANYQTIMRLLDKHQEQEHAAGRTPKPSASETLAEASAKVPPLSMPAEDPNPDINRAIQEGFLRLISARKGYLEHARRRIGTDPQALEVVRSFLLSANRSSCWTALFPGETPPLDAQSTSS